MTVSALLPLKNAAKYLENIKIQVNRTFSQNDEILIVDDKSDDDTFSRVSEWATNDQRIRLISNSNPGLANALNLGIKEASNIWVARIDSDDTYRADRIQAQLSVVDPGTVAVFSDYKFKGKGKLPLGYMPSAVSPSAVSVSLASSRRTPHPVALLNRDAVIGAGGYLQEHFPAEDLSLWLRLSRLGDLRSVPLPLLNYTLNRKGVSITQRRIQLEMRNSLLEEIGINKIDITKVYSELENILNSYRNTEHAFVRSVLLISEISSLKVINFDLKKNLQTLQMATDRKIIRSAMDGAAFAGSTFCRKLYRN